MQDRCMVLLTCTMCHMLLAWQIDVYHTVSLSLCFFHTSFMVGPLTTKCHLVTDVQLDKTRCFRLDKTRSQAGPIKFQGVPIWTNSGVLSSENPESGFQVYQTDKSGVCAGSAHVQMSPRWPGHLVKSTQVWYWFNANCFPENSILLSE